jgi:hypothetical protein
MHMSINLNYKFFLVLLGVLFVNGCATVKVVDTWKTEYLEDVKDKNVLVITRTSNTKVRALFEDAFLKRMTAKDIKGSVSYDFIENIDTEKKLTTAQIESAKKAIQAKGYNAVVLTILKDRKSEVTVTTDGGYNTGATYSSEVNPFLYDFYTAFASPYTAPSMRHSGYYVEQSFQEQEYITYILETLVFDLDKPEKQQLVAKVTSKLESPTSATQVADDYARKVANAIKK